MRLTFTTLKLWFTFVIWIGLCLSTDESSINQGKNFSCTNISKKLFDIFFPINCFQYLRIYYHIYSHPLKIKAQNDVQPIRKISLKILCLFFYSFRAWKKKIGHVRERFSRWHFFWWLWRISDNEKKISSNKFTKTWFVRFKTVDSEKSPEGTTALLFFPLHRIDFLWGISYWLKF